MEAMRMRYMKGRSVSHTSIVPQTNSYPQSDLKGLSMKVSVVVTHSTIPSIGTGKCP